MNSTQDTCTALDQEGQKAASMPYGAACPLPDKKQSPGDQLLDDALDFGKSILIDEAKDQIISPILDRVPPVKLARDAYDGMTGGHGWFGSKACALAVDAYLASQGRPPSAYKSVVEAERKF